MAPAPRLSKAQVTALFERSNGVAWDLPLAAFDAALHGCLEKAFAGSPPDAAEIERFLNSLHLEDLALAVACAQGLSPAWDHFVATHRASLVRAADAIDARGGAREIAESLFADLFGVNERGAARPSLLRYFHGRSRLGTWLRAVLTQRYIDRVRASKRTESLDDQAETMASAAPVCPDPQRGRHVDALQSALTAAIAELDPRDRLRLACYHGDGMTLAAIGRMLKEHEATVSRHLTRTRREVRDAVEVRLIRGFGMDQAAVAECFRAAAEDAGSMDISEVLESQSDRATGKNALPDRSST